MFARVLDIIFEMGLCILCAALAIKALVRGEFAIIRFGLMHFPRNDGRPPARVVYTRIKDPVDYWMGVASLIAATLAALFVIVLTAFFALIWFGAH